MFSRYHSCCWNEVAEVKMSQNPGTDDRSERDDEVETNTRFEERNNEETSQNKGHGPLKGTDTPATTLAEDLEKARRTTM
jgi:hypothetical protein